MASSTWRTVLGVAPARSRALSTRTRASSRCSRALRISASAGWDLALRELEARQAISPYTDCDSASQGTCTGPDTVCMSLPRRVLLPADTYVVERRQVRALLADPANGGATAASIMTESEALINSLRAEMEKNQQLREQLSAKEQVRSFQSLTFTLTHTWRTGEAGSRVDTRARGGTGARALRTTHARTRARARRPPAGLGVLMGAAAQVIAGIERDKRDLERDLERRNMENRSTLQMMASLQDSHQQQVPTARRPDSWPPRTSTSGVSVRGVLADASAMFMMILKKN